MALFKVKRYGMERHRVTEGEDNGLIVTGVRVLIDLRCSNATEEQILSRLRDVMQGNDPKTSEEEICQQIENLFKEEFTSVRVSISREHKNRKCYICCPFSIHVSQDEENGGIGISIREAEDMMREESMEVLTISVRRKIF